jgi:uncharacterized membrane protein YfcA
VGAIFAAKVSHKLASQARLFQVVGIGFMLFMIVQTAQRNASSPGFGTSLTPVLLWILLGLGTGALSQSLSLPSGLLLIPALYYFAGFAPYEAIGIAVMVVALAAVLPAWGYTQRGLFEKVYGTPATYGGILGGVLGGLTLGRWGEASDKGLLYLFATVAMFFCARELARPTTK